MTCSKIFSGDLPELIYEVIKYFKNDFSTLHSCILVNRLWCRLAIPLLWENPFSIPTKNYKFIDVYLHDLNDELLNKYDINFNLLLHSNTLFNYPSFLKYLNTRRFICSITKWSKDIVFNIELLSVSNFKSLIYMSLFKVFIENEVNLQTFEIWVGNYNPYLDDILELMLQNPNFIHNVKNLSLYTHIFHHNNNKPYTSIINHISQIINLHQNLKKIVLSYKSFLLYKPLLLSKVSNCSNTLNIIRFYHIDFKGMINFNEVFEQLNALESVHIVYCYSLDTHFIQQIINLTKPFKLKSLFINEGSRIDESLQLLLQKSGSYIENFGFGFGFGHSYTLSLKKKLIELIIKYCKNIKFLDICEVDNQIIYPMFNLIENIKENLNYLSIKTSEASQLCDSSSSIILQNLGQFLSLKLDYLNLTLIVNISDFKIFLEKSQNIFIKKLLIKNLMRKDSYVILPYIKEYNNIMKGKGIRYLAFMDNSNNNLFYSKDETKEFMLDDNIKVQKYDDLYISTFQFIRNLD